MNQHLVLSPEQARKIILHAAGLAKKAQFGKGREAVYKLIKHLGFIQIDTNYVVERAHHHSIAARVPDYKPEWLNELQTDERIYEYLTFASGYMPMEDFRFSLPVKAGFMEQRETLPLPERNVMNKVLDRISREGPLMVKDFENDRKEASSGWWDWRPAKMALERLYFDGRLMNTRGKDFHKLFDLPNNMVPSDTDMTMPTPEEYARFVIHRSLRSLGIAYIKEIAYSSRFVSNVIKTEIKKLVDEGKVLSVEIAGKKTAPLYMLPVYKNKKITISDEAFILSPFDILNVFRHRLKDFFNFDYQVECFVPAPKRKYGYFSLPILIGDTFIARMDSKADRKEHELTIHNLHFEKIRLTKPQIEKLTDAIRSFAKFNQCSTILIKRSNDKTLLAAIRRSLNH